MSPLLAVSQHSAALLGGLAACCALLIAGGAAIWHAVGESPQAAAHSPVPSTKTPMPAPPSDAAAAAPQDTAMRRAIPLRWLPADARYVVSTPNEQLAANSRSAALWRPLLDAGGFNTAPLLAALGLSDATVARTSWASVALPPAAPGGFTGVAVLQIEDDATLRKNVADAMAKGGVVGATIGTFTIRRLPGEWPLPVLAVDESTIVTGSEKQLRALAAGQSTAETATSKMFALLRGGAHEPGVMAAIDAGALAEIVADLRRLPIAGIGDDDQQRWAATPASVSALLLYDRSASDDSVNGVLEIACTSESTAEAIAGDATRLLAIVADALKAHGKALAEDLGAGRVSAEDAEPVDWFLTSSADALESAQTQRLGDVVQVQLRFDGDAGRLVDAWAIARAAMSHRWRQSLEEADQRRHEQLAQGLLGHERAEGALPRGAGGAELLPPETRLSWLASMLPYYGRMDWHRELNFGRPWNDPANRGVTGRPFDLVVNPAIPQTHSDAGFPVTHYVGVAGVGADAADLPATDPRAGAFGFRRQLRTADVRDGSSQTIAILGVSRDLGPWAAGGRGSVRPLTRAPYVNGPDGFGSGQADGMLAGMLDGSVQFLSSDIDPRVMEQLATANGGDIVDLQAVAPPRPSASPRPRPADVAADTPPAPIADAAPAPTPEVDFDERLREPIDAIALRDAPLRDVVETLAAAAGVEITIDPAGLAEAQASVDEPINEEFAQLTVGEVFDALLAARGLALVADGPGLVVTNSRRQRETLSTVDYDLADLTRGAPEQVARIADMLERFVEPTSWRAAGGRGDAQIRGETLRIVQDQFAQKQIAAFLDKLRSARGLPSRTAAVVDLDTRSTQAAPALAMPVTGNFQGQTTLRAALRHLEQQADVHLFIDGPALAAIGKSPQSIVHGAVSGQPLGEALDQLLAPLHLSIRAVGPQTVQVTSAQAATTALEIEFYPVASLLRDDFGGPQLLEQVQGEVAAASWVKAGGPGVIDFDSESSTLIVLQTQSVQRRIEALLASIAKTE